MTPIRHDTDRDLALVRNPAYDPGPTTPRSANLVDEVRFQVHGNIERLFERRERRVGSAVVHGSANPERYEADPELDAELRSVHSIGRGTSR